MIIKKIIKSQTLHVSLTWHTCLFLFTGSFSWRKYEMKNCYDGHGADSSFHTNPYSHSVSLFDCQQACEVDDSCEGIIVGVGIIRDDWGRCHKRRKIQLCNCLDNPGHNLFIKVTDGQSTTTNRCKTTTTTTTALTSNVDKATDLADLAEMI